MKKQHFIARLMHKITFVENITQSNIKKPNWRKCRTSFAEIKPVCDNRVLFLEGLKFGNIMSEKYFIFKIRLLRDINSTMRIYFQKRIFEIKRMIDQDERGRVLNIIALEIGKI